MPCSKTVKGICCIVSAMCTHLVSNSILIYSIRYWEMHILGQTSMSIMFHMLDYTMIQSI